MELFFNTNYFSIIDLLLWSVLMIILGADIGHGLNKRNHKPNKTKEKEKRK